MPPHLPWQQEDLRRAREERTVAARDLQLDASSAKAEAARLAQELHSAQSTAEQAQHAAEEARRALQQASARAEGAWKESRLGGDEWRGS